MNNVVIKSVKKYDGKEIIDFFRSKNIDTKNFIGNLYSDCGDIDCYYGVINNNFGYFSEQYVKNNKIGILSIEQALGNNFNIWF